MVAKGKRVLEVTVPRKDKTLTLPPPSAHINPRPRFKTQLPCDVGGADKGPLMRGDLCLPTPAVGLRCWLGPVALRIPWEDPEEGLILLIACS
ncbi:unnamed protein product [Rangifer tarandus platyrhynchus]|uniref:Uncharacterized protein n=2 Tax=Rangifer tarandus platyrhynchus TaxID=3082113 RepID=A0ABN8ZQY7_RANTA|nr:unnamed protein product [Rangifer tarandus platyrhynchus]CAI9709312.1 unnamed protein product [Rangifer tarandus platyrhynchus]